MRARVPRSSRRVVAVVCFGLIASGCGDSHGGPCAPMDAAEGDPCGPTEDPAVRYRWDGDGCARVLWCDCDGDDCAALYDSEAACFAAYAACRDAAPGMDAGGPERDAGGPRDDAGGSGDDAGAAPDGGDPGGDGGSPSDAGGACAAMDAMEGEPCGPTEDPAVRWRWDGEACVTAAWCDCVGADCGELFDAEAACETAFAACLEGGCATDDDCEAGAEWCEGGRCVECDNDGLACRLACPEGWSLYRRNGCSPCACAPDNECVRDADCAGTGGGTPKCYAGAFCWDWCPENDPSCCFGNVCDAAGCEPPPPVGCDTRGCPLGQTCRRDMGCASSSCGCGDGGWFCTDDCGGGVCVAE
ncbi:MAG TPA: hypothetical protein RMH99_15830 [Sandaracinaceae bacterium LLY-WYZ-13_1]|nr:hypothetical protein [Sandaracinaceae bacterium LLY-WYZ-13_1]